MKDQWLNYRPLCLVFSFLLLGTIFAFYITINTVLTIIVAVCVLAILVFISIKNKTPKFIIIAITSFAISVGVYFVCINQFSNKTIELPTTVEARVYSINTPKDGSLLLQADSTIFDGKEVDSNLIIYIYDSHNDFSSFKIGDVLEIKPSKIYCTDLFYTNLPNSRYYSNNLKYSITANREDVTIKTNDKTFAEEIRLKIKDNLHYGLSNENVEIAYSALFGDKSMLSRDQYNAYKLSGIAHMLAVSGLHVGIITSLLNKLLKLCRVKRKVGFVIIAIILGFYMYMCNFSISVVRASVMSLIMLLAPIIHKEYDSLSAIGFAGIVCFILNPLLAFDVSALMSFSCVTGIILLSKSFTKVFERIKLPKFLSTSLAVSAATTISMIVIMAFFFNNLNIISVLANIILIPVFTFAFTITFVVAMLSLICPYVTYILYPIGYIYDFINLMSVIFANLPISNFSTISFDYMAIVAYFMFLLFVSRICTAKRVNKIIYTLPIVAILFVCLL